uniref:alpha/beta hydrolase n=1 Tax=Eubacterium cellulosolvens TaxID=29322 RepID=UPI000485F495|nr:alpha/beta hydrolase [[Eubacterium] cellulosolvens]
MSFMSRMIRRSFRKNDVIRDRGLSTPADVQRFDDILYGTDPKWQVLDVYRPKTEQGVLPVIVSFHGGAFVYGDKELYQFYCMSLAQLGFAVVNFTYRLAPEFKFPAPMEDANLVFGWLLEHAGEYGFDTDRIFAVGDSAGAHGLATYLNVVTNPAYAANFSFRVPEKLVIRAAALNCGIYGLKGTDPRDRLTRAIMKDYLPGRGTKRELELTEVALNLTTNFPPVFLMTCSGDFLQDQAPPLAKAFEEKGILYEYHFYSAGEQELGHVFHLDLRTKYSGICNREECEFFVKCVS